MEQKIVEKMCYNLQHRITAATLICQSTTANNSTLPAEHHRPTGFLCGRSVGVEFLISPTSVHHCLLNQSLSITSPLQAQNLM